MKFVLIATFLITGSAFAYNTSTVGNHPPKEEAVAVEKREPASVETKDMKPADKVKQPKVAAEK